MAAFMATHGLPVLRYLTTTDDAERVVLEAVALEIYEEERKANRG